MHASYLNATLINAKGGSNFQASFGPGRYNAYVCVDFRVSSSESSSQPVAPVEYGVWTSSGAVRGQVTGAQITRSAPLGALLTFPAVDRAQTTIFVRSGVSFVSTAQACANAEAEIPDFNFDEISNAARAQWNNLLSTVDVEITQGQEDLRVLFYSSVSLCEIGNLRFTELTINKLYRTHISPADCEYLSYFSVLSLNSMR